MKKLLLAAILIVFVAGAWAQTWTSTSTPDTAWIIFKVDMIGFMFTANWGGAGAENNDPYAVGTHALTTALVAESLVTTAVDVKPCELLHGVFWLENIGGVTANFDVWHLHRGLDAAGSATGTWSEDAGADPDACAGLDEDEYVIGFDATAILSSDGSAATPLAAAMDFTRIPVGSGTCSFQNVSGVAGLVAEDPASFGDGTWTIEIDQAELHIGLRAPSSASNPATINRIAIMIEGEPNGTD